MVITYHLEKKSKKILKITANLRTLTYTQSDFDTFLETFHQVYQSSPD